MQGLAAREALQCHPGAWASGKPWVWVSPAAGGAGAERMGRGLLSFGADGCHCKASLVPGHQVWASPAGGGGAEKMGFRGFLASGARPLIWQGLSGARALSKPWVWASPAAGGGAGGGGAEKMGRGLLASGADGQHCKASHLARPLWCLGKPWVWASPAGGAVVQRGWALEAS